MCSRGRVRRRRLDELVGIVARRAGAARRASSASPPGRRRCGSPPRRSGTASPAPTSSCPTESGPRCSELNCDTPTGEAEAVVPQRRSPPATGPARSQPRARRPLLRYRSRCRRARRSAAPARPRDGRLRLPDRVHRGPLASSRLYRALARGARLARSIARLALQPASRRRRRRRALRRAAATSCSATTRPTGGASACRCWDDEEPFADAEPLAEPLARCSSAARSPGGARWSTRSARCSRRTSAPWPSCWEALDASRPLSQAIIRAPVPFTLRLEAADRDVLRREREGWVLKSDYGAEGDEVIIGRETPTEVWAYSLAHAIPRRWIAQRYFESRRDEAGRDVNHGCTWSPVFASRASTPASGAPDGRLLHLFLFFDLAYEPFSASPEISFLAFSPFSTSLSFTFSLFFNYRISSFTPYLSYNPTASILSFKSFSSFPLSSSLYSFFLFLSISFTPFPITIILFTLSISISSLPFTSSTSTSSLPSSTFLSLTSTSSISFFLLFSFYFSPIFSLLPISSFFLSTLLLSSIFPFTSPSFLFFSIFFLSSTPIFTTPTISRRRSRSPPNRSAPEPPPPPSP